MESEYHCLNLVSQFCLTKLHHVLWCFVWSSSIDRRLSNTHESRDFVSCYEDIHILQTLQTRSVLWHYDSLVLTYYLRTYANVHCSHYQTVNVSHLRCDASTVLVAASTKECNQSPKKRFLLILLALPTLLVLLAGRHKWMRFNI